MKPTRQIFHCLRPFLENSTRGPWLKLFEVRTHWPLAVGERLSRHSRPRRIEAHCLHVEVEDRAYAQAMEFRKNDILAYLKVLLKGNFVRELRFSVAEGNPIAKSADQRHHLPGKSKNQA